jgi:hypothetical protein
MDEKSFNKRDLRALSGMINTNAYNAAMKIIMEKCALEAANGNYCANFNDLNMIRIPNLKENLETRGLEITIYDGQRDDPHSFTVSWA